jgi:deoxyribodipyrimidine photo-lyase
VTGPALVWFRDDHRLSDHPALAAAAASGRPVLCLAVLDETSPGTRPLGGAARWWLHGSLDALDRSLRARGAELCLFEGPAADIVPEVAARTQASLVTWNRRHTRAEAAIDDATEAKLRSRGIAVESFSGRYLNEPGSVRSKADRPFMVFTPYLRAVRSRGEPAAPTPAPRRIRGAAAGCLDGMRVELASLGLEPTHPDWAAPFRALWRRGEAAAQDRLSDFLAERFSGYAHNRDRPGLEGTSRLSPHLRFGEISPRQVWHAVTAAARANPASGRESDVDKLLAEVVWRDFSAEQLAAFPELASTPHDRRFDRFPWRDDAAALKAWQRGRTGYPIVDAGMRQLWRTGWMHNRVRMIAASFLVKHLLLDWRHGEAWFWDTLVDADPANNAFSWQWIAGSGPDASPFHRIFSPLAQGETFDNEGAYVRRYVPELARLPDAFIHRPWDAPAALLAEAGVALGDTYPEPIVRHEAARTRALAAARAMRGEAA